MFYLQPAVSPAVGEKLDDQDLARPKVRKKPEIEATIPPISNHTVLSVGAPVKNRETSELKESEALTPKMINTIPPTSNAIPSGLFISFRFIG